ncbi:MULTISPECIES: hypothetical protein [unclassified Spirillospora]|uniref:hypothetical protein n=1 Tax=unclassified Spirillospora TaxID=2642701 RepID=UPI003718D0F6
MPLPDRTRHVDGDHPIRASRMSLTGPVSIIAVALIVFTVFWATTTPPMAVIMAMATLAAGTFLLVLVFGTGRLRGRTRSPELWRRR